jgi:hypothetical protein
MAMRTSASTTSSPASARAARVCSTRLAPVRPRASPVMVTPPPGVSISTLKASSIRAA